MHFSIICDIHTMCVWLELELQQVERAWRSCCACQAKERQTHSRGHLNFANPICQCSIAPLSAYTTHSTTIWQQWSKKWRDKIYCIFDISSHNSQLPVYIQPNSNVTRENVCVMTTIKLKSPPKCANKTFGWVEWEDENKSLKTNSTYILWTLISCRDCVVRHILPS